MSTSATQGGHNKYLSIHRHVLATKQHHTNLQHLILIRTKSVDKARVSVDNANLDRCWLRANSGGASRQLRRQRGAGGRSARLADLPENWPATSPCDAAAVTPREPKSR